MGLGFFGVGDGFKQGSGMSPWLFNEWIDNKTPAIAFIPLRKPNVRVMYGPLNDRGVPEECHSLFRALPEVLPCMYVMRVLVYL